MPDDRTAYTMPGAVQIDLRPVRGGEPYRIFLSIPREDPPEDGWPLLLLTDGNACFPLAAASLAVQAPYPLGTNVGQGVVAAIGYPTDSPYDPLRRSWDLGPPPGKTYPPFAPGGPAVVTGGTEALFDFIEAEVLPFLEGHVRLNRSRRALFGHSFGGLCTLYGLFTRPALFDTWIAASPAIYWEDCAILRDEACRRPISGAGRSLYLSAGDYEGDALAPFQQGRDDAAARLDKKRQTRTVALARDMAQRLDQPDGGLRASFDLYPGETHMSVLPIAVHRAVQIAFELPGKAIAG